MTGSSSEQLRRTIVRATVPLLGEYDTLTTAQIAAAAGIKEADLLAAFPDKEKIMQACVTAITEHLRAAIDPTREVRKLDAIRMDQPLASRLAEVLDIVDAYYRRIRTDFAAFEQTVMTAPGTAGTSWSGGQDLRHLSGLPEIRQAVTRLLEPDRQTLRLPTAALAEAFLTMTTAGYRNANEHRPPLPAEQVVDLFLHGALAAS